jgi:hypothetical protein
MAAKKGAQKTLNGGFDAAEMARRSHERRRLNKAAAEDQAAAVEGVDVASLPRQRLIELLRDARTRPADVVAAAKALAALPEEKEEAGWRNSVQVRPDFEPPGWGQVLVVARAAGAFDK